MRPLLVSILCLLALPAAAHAAPDQVMSFEAPRELIDDTRRDVVLDEIRAFGVTQVRQLVYWRDFAPGKRRKRKPRFDASDPGAYPAGTWGRLDRLMNAAGARGIDVMLTLTGPVPRWATKNRKGGHKRPRARLFRQFAEAVGRRYGDRVSMWSIWNEPNQPQFLRPQYRKGRPYSPRLYRGLYRAGHRGIRRSPDNRGDRILIAETSPRGNQNVVHPLKFLRGMLCLNGRYRKTRKCARLPADGYAHHAYTTRTGPRFVPPHKDDVTIGVISRLVRALDRAGRAGALPRHLPIYLTEFGIQSFPDRRSGVPYKRQPAYQAISEHIAYVNPRVALFSQYLMSDDLPRNRGYRFAGFESGLRRADGRRKPSYRAFANPLAVERYAGRDVLWGMIRPQREKTRVTIEIRRKRRWATLERLTTTSTGVFAASARRRKGQHYRVRWTPRGSDRERVGPPVRSYKVR